VFAAILVCLFAPQASPADRLAKLGYERGAFETNLVRQEKFSGYDRLGAAVGAQFPSSTAYFPVGVSSHRVMWIQFDGYDQLLYQEVRHGRPQTLWYLTLVKGKSHRPTHGTLRRAIYAIGLRIKSRHVLKAARAVLDSECAYASYFHHLMMGLLMSGITKDGGSWPGEQGDDSPLQAKPPFLPILAEEAKLIGLGDKPWPGPGKYTVEPVPADNRVEPIFAHSGRAIMTPMFFLYFTA